MKQEREPQLSPKLEFDVEKEPTSQELILLEAALADEDRDDLSGKAINQAGQAQVIDDQDHFQHFMYQVNQAPLLSFAQEQELSRLAINGAETDTTELEKAQTRTTAREILILSNQRLVLKIAKKYTWMGLPFEDLIQEGNIGLLIGLSKWDYTRGYRFSTYVTWWIYQSIRRAPLEKARSIRIPVHSEEKLALINGIKRELHQSQRKVPSVKEVATRILELGLEARFLHSSESKTEEQKRAYLEKLIKRLALASEEPLELDRELGSDGVASLGEIIADSKNPQPELWTAQRLAAAQVRELLKCLSPRDQMVMEMRFGILAGEEGTEFTLEEVGEKIGVTRERVRQIQVAAISRVRRVARGQGITSDLFVE